MKLIAIKSRSKGLTAFKVYETIGWGRFNGPKFLIYDDANQWNMYNIELFKPADMVEEEVTKELTSRYLPGELPRQISEHQI